MPNISLLSIPVELLLKIVEYLDVFSIIRLSWVSRGHHSALGVSRAFWSRYCRLLLQDERLPSSCFNLDTLNVSELIQLATRSERIARALDTQSPQNPCRARRAQFQLGHDPSFHIKHLDIYQAPGGRWVLSLASNSQDNSIHIMCWDTSEADSDVAPLIPPSASAELRPFAPTGTAMVYHLHPPTYDPKTQRYSCFITGVANLPGTSGFRQCITIPVEMEDRDPHPPSFSFPDQATIWLRAPRTEFQPSGRWAVICSPAHEPRSIVWDSQSGQTSDYPVARDSATTFDRIVVTHDGIILRVQGGIHMNKLDVRFSPASATEVVIPVHSTSFTVAGTRHFVPSHASGRTQFLVFTSGTIRLLEQSTATLIQVECHTFTHRFCTAVTVSADGAIQTPRNEHWRRNEYLIPLWTSKPSSHFILTTLVDRPPTRARFGVASTTVTLNDKKLFLKYIPPTSKTLGVEPQFTLDVPTRPFDTGITMEKGCRSVCLRSGQWMFVRKGHDNYHAVMLIRYR
ncbi:hypothetical protein DL93DRAFT_352987 [Clavulina sp. PMI_390]|nr:hypothetical protein DL93DRAFT_352987 [Clavulina sp. PMI_390]